MPLPTRRLATAVLASTVIASAGAAAPAGLLSPATAADPCTSSASDTHPIERIAGTDRWRTAACVSEVAFPDGADHVIIARGDQAGGWADALAGTVLAQALDAPVLLTPPDRLHDAARDEIQRLGATTAIVLGGPNALSTDVEDALRGLVGEVERIAGTGRAATAALVSRSAGATGHAFVVNGHRPADALVAGATAARRGAALLLVDAVAVPDATADAFDTLGISRVTIVGGPGVVAPEVEDELRARFGAAAVERVSGPSRQETAASMARAYGGGADPTVTLVNGTDASLVDAIGASWFAARTDDGPVLYVEDDVVTHGTNRYLRLGGIRDGARIRLVGGAGVIGPATVSELEDRLDEAGRGGPAPQVRGMWIHLFDDSLKSPAAMDRMLDAAVHANLNTIIVQAARRHDAYYSTDQIPRTVDPAMPADLDLLATLLPRAHARGLDVHAWYSLMPSWHSVYEDLPVQPWHVHEAHGPDSDDPWTTQNNSATYAYLDPGVPGVQDHVVDMLADVLRRYDLDGIHLDYLRYSSAAAGFHPTSIARFDRLGNGNFDDWRRRQTSDLARRIWLELTAIRPDVTVSMAAIAMGDGPSGEDLMASYRQTKPYADKFQDWVGWLDEGFIDAVYPMAYFRESSHGVWYDHWVDFLGSLDTDRILAIGQAAYLNTIEQSLSQTDQALAATDGMVTYAWQQDSSNVPRGTLLLELAARHYADPAPAPEPTFKTADPDGHALVEGLEDGEVVTATRGGVVRTMVADATGHAGFLGLGPGTWTFQAGGATRTVAISAARVARVVL